MLTTKRLILRRWLPTDLGPFAELNACDRVCEFLPGTLNRMESDALAEKIIDHFKEHGFGFFAVEEKLTGAFIGFTGLRIPHFEAHFTPGVEIGWRLGYPHWGQGFATEAATAVLEYGFDRLDISQIVSMTVPANTRSRRVMEKIGLHHHEGDDFDHPDLPHGHRLRRHVLYRLRKQDRT